MKAIKLQIHNFRSICDATIRLSPCGLLVGVNNAGKSSVIDAIRAVYNKGVKFDAGRDFPKRSAKDKESWVEIEFKPSADELKNLKDEYKTERGTFRVRNYFLSEDKDSAGKIKSGPYAYVDGALSDSRFYGFKNVGQGKFGSIIYIPSVSKIDEHTKLTGPSALRELVNTVLSSVMDSSSAYKDLRQSFETFEGSIKTETTTDGLSLQGIEEDVSQELGDWGTTFRLTINAVSVDEIVKSLIGHEIVDKSLGASQPISSYGQGFQRSVIYSLIRVAAKHTATKSKTAKKGFDPELTWILFEEPEAFLHPTQVAALSGALREFANGDSNQVLLSTHSPHFASRNVQDIPNICRLHREECQTFAYQLTPNTLSAIISSNQSDAAGWNSKGLPVDPDDLETDMEGVKYALWLDSRRCGAFFAERVLLVEGPSETALLSYLSDTGQIRGCKDLFVLDTIGKFNIHRFMRLFNELGIRHYVLYDKDEGRHAVVEDTITATATQSKFTRGVDSFPKDLEAFLGITPSKLKHRKPQHVMLKVTSGKVAKSKLEALAKKVTMLISS